jgi:hypothetical protein
VFEDRVLRKMFGPKRDEVTGDWLKLHSEEIHDLYSSNIQVNKSRRRWMGYATRMGRDACRVLVETPEGKGPL